MALYRPTPALLDGQDAPLVTQLTRQSAHVAVGVVERDKQR
eukprot:CAMPEP_0182596956 /NCGR_PEP_ID=MMETSP1324-20130603/85304_1 /TAXON_ID=236786 /ORGANISM="Florenciella sp., Strain RCC1587" /LENGTH=40 /DNA_ID= /DNA_START= /DNA_END= /DNA_ORIENTATION=